MRRAGILLAITSLPSEYGIGCFSKEAYEFIDMLALCDQSFWQILPLGPTGYGDSPYQSFSTFAGNPYMICLDELIRKGMLTESECADAAAGESEDDIDYSGLYQNRYPLLRKAYGRSGAESDSAFIGFTDKNAWWLDDYALFMALKDKFGGKPWTEWPDDIRLRKNGAAEGYAEELRNDIGFHKYIQYLFYDQWNRLKQYANDRDIKIIGDIPIYVSMDSADVWTNPELFQLDDNNVPVAVAGCPPDGFSADGQLWGNPLYDWERHRSTGYSWWINRLRYCFRLYDIVRIDHFRGFDEYYSIPYGSRTAAGGHWEKGPGIDLFDAVRKELGEKEVIAEDLGYMTDSVRELVRKTGFPNMKVLEFAFDERDTGCRSEYYPHNYSSNCVAYTGTHDNQTLISWFDTITDKEKKLAREYLCNQYTPADKLNLPFISLVMMSAAEKCIIPLQDYLGLDDRARINKPSTVGTNWRWRVRKSELSAGLMMMIKDMTDRYGRGE